MATYDRWLYTLLLCIYSQTDTGKPSAPKFKCTNSEYTRPRLSKELFLLVSEKLPLWHFVAAPSNTPLDIQDL